MTFPGERVVADVLRVLPLRTPTLPPATDTNACLFGVPGGEAIVIEPATPYDDERARMLAWLRHHEAQGTRIRFVALTHHHVDHVGAAEWLRDQLGVPLIAHELTRSRLEGTIAIDRAIADRTRICLAVTRPHGRTGPSPDDLVIEALHTPGHAPGHLCFWEKESKSLVAGDMVAGTGTILVEATDGDVGLYLASLERLAKLEPRAIVPAHGDVLESEVFPRYIAHRKAREAKILAALTGLGGSRTIDEIVPLAYADTSPAAWPLAKLATEAHLIHLAQQGAVRGDDGRWVATPTA